MRAARVKPRLEKHEQADCVKLLKSLGAAVYVLGTVRPRADSYHGTCQTPGIADIEAWMPVKGEPGARKLLKLEVKRARGARLSPEQKAYAAHCHAAGVDYVCGDLTALMRWLVADGYLRRDQLPAGDA